MTENYDIAIPIKKLVVVWSDSLEIFGEGDSEESALDDFFVVARELQETFSLETAGNLSEHLRQQQEILNNVFRTEEWS